MIESGYATLRVPRPLTNDLCGGRMAVKKCTRCGVLKPFRAFTARPLVSGKSIPISHCMACRAASAKERRHADPDRARDIQARSRAKHPKEFHYERARKGHLRVKYGVTPEQYEAMHSAQRGLCAICGKPEVTTDRRSGGTRKLAVDHCHATDKVRELLCVKCNAAIGHFADDIDRVRRALAYLQKHATDPA